jgi:Uma2 family endonuclease
MAIEVAHPLFSYDDYAALDDGNRYEVIEGELIMPPSPTVNHQIIVGQLNFLLDAHVRATGAGTVLTAPLDVVLRSERPGVVVQPDLMFVSKENFEILTKANIQGAPDLAIEVLSPSNQRLDTIAKRRIYAQYGVKEYWIVFPDADRIEVFTLSGTATYGKPTLYEPGDTLKTPLLPGFELALAFVFSKE